MANGDVAVDNEVLLADTHCHIHSAQYTDLQPDHTVQKWIKAGRPSPDELIANAVGEGVNWMICVGTDVEDSVLAADCAAARSSVWASIGIHPHEAQRYVNSPADLQRFALLASRPKVVAVGECGLDYYYTHSPKAAQLELLRCQIELALANNLPIVFHVRDAFDDFWPVFDEYRGVRGVIHSFTADTRTLEKTLERGLYVGLNGIMTFTKDAAQLEAAKAVPLQKLLLETDAPYLTPAPYRGKICEPKFVKATAEFLGEIRHENVENLAAATSANAVALFNL
jgi:TatD DNase family protein